MTLTIITGTHSFIDLTGRFRRAYLQSMQGMVKYTINGLTFTKRRFDRVEITKEGKIIREPSRLFPMDRNGLWWSVSQPTGSGKTILAAYDMNRVYKRGGRVEGNLSFRHFKHNEGLEPEQWKPSILSIEDLQEVKKCFCVLDDIKGTISSWQAREADIITLTSNTGRKEGVDLEITTQRIVNYVPPNIRAVCTGIEIPYITIRDQRLDSPDSKGYPVEMEVLSLIPGDSGDIFVGFGTLNKDIPDGRIVTPSYELLNSYRTMELATSLKVGAKETARPSQPGYELEARAVAYLKQYFKDVEHLNGKMVFDVSTSTHLFDVCSMDDDGYLITEHKNLLRHIKTAKKVGKIPYLMFPYHDKWGFVKITPRVSDEATGKRIRTDNIPMRGIDGIMLK